MYNSFFYCFFCCFFCFFLILSHQLIFYEFHITNSEILLIKISKVLGGYTSFVEKVRKYEGLNIQLQNAIERAIEECINEDILTDFFKEHRVEVTRQAMLDFTFERQLELERRDRYEEGITAGSQKHLLALICRKLKKNKSLDNIAEELEEDISVVEPLYIFAQGFAPDYNEEQVFEAYKNMK